jgi:hypothetical protein
MFNVSKIQSGLYGVVGLRQPHNPDYQKLDSANQISRSGYFITDNSSIKIEHIYDSVDFKGLTDAEFNTFLKQKQEESIVSVCNQVFNRSSYIDRDLLYKYAQNKVATDILSNGFVGHEIKVSKEKNISFEITRVLLDFSTTGTLELALFNTALETPIFSKSIVITDKHQVEKLNWRVDNSGDTYKGDYYFGYVTDGTLIPYARDFENSIVESNITHLNIERVAVPNHTGTNIFDLTKVESLSEVTGLNPDITVFEDYTDLILQNEMLFANAINLDFQINILSNYSNSLRSNRNERKSDGLVLKILQEIEGQQGDGLVTITGLRPQLLRSIKNIKSEVDSLIKGYFGGKLSTITMI